MLRWLWLACIAPAAFVATMGHAKVPVSLCNDIRALSQKDGTRWFGVGSNNKVTSLKVDTTYSQDGLTKIVYLHSRPDQNPSRTIAAAKIIFQTQDNYIDQDWVRAQNNFKRKALSLKYSDYNSANDGSSENFSLMANFHLPAGRDIPFSTYSPDRRRQLVFPKNSANEERSYRAYLINLDGIAPQGSCIDFSPNFPSGTKRTTVEVIDLLPSDDDVYDRATIRFGVSQ